MAQQRRAFSLYGGSSGCVRLTHAQVRVNFDEQQVWNVDYYGNWDPTSPYYRLFRQ